MCFSNLPVEFDEDGDPHLADEADDVTSPGEDDQVGIVADGGGCDPDADATIDAGPEAAYDAILAEMPETARSDLASGDTTSLAIGSDANADADDRHGRDTIESD